MCWPAEDTVTKLPETFTVPTDHLSFKLAMTIKPKRRKNWVSNTGYFASRHIFDHLGTGQKFLSFWLMLLYRQKVSHGICCAKIKALLAPPLLLRSYKAKKLPFAFTYWIHTSGSADVIRFPERYLLHDYINPLLSKELNSLSRKVGANSPYRSSRILMDNTAKRQEKNKTRNT